MFAALLPLPCVTGVSVEESSTTDDMERALVLADTSSGGRPPAIDGILQLDTPVYVCMNLAAE